VAVVPLPFVRRTVGHIEEVDVAVVVYILFIIKKKLVDEKEHKKKHTKGSNDGLNHRLSP
jgi:hypothetical protein